MAKVDKNLHAENAAWTFEGIADVFDEHVAKSVPLYSEGHDLICQLSDHFLHPQANITELGTSTGALAQRLLNHNRPRGDLTYVGVDRSTAMIEQATLRCQDDARARFVLADLEHYLFEKSAMIVSYYTLQFVHPRARQDVFNRMYEALEWGGALLLFEKVRSPDARFQDITSQIYLEYKLQSNFSEAEIVHKQRSLKGVLEPFSTQGNLDLMKRAGFVDIMSIMKWVCFEGFLAIK